MLAWAVQIGCVLVIIGMFLYLYFLPEPGQRGRPHR